MLLLKDVDAAKKQLRRFKHEAADIVLKYVDATIAHWGAGSLHSSDLDLLYTITRCVAAMTHEEGGYEALIGMRILDTLKEISLARYHRHALEARHLDRNFWTFSGLLSTATFFGTAMIFSGSNMLNFAFCYITVAVIGLATFATSSPLATMARSLTTLTPTITRTPTLIPFPVQIIADLDYPHDGSIRFGVDQFEGLRVAVRRSMRAALPSPDGDQEGLPEVAYSALRRPSFSKAAPLHPEAETDGSSRPASRRTPATTSAGAGPT